MWEKVSEKTRRDRAEFVERQKKSVGCQNKCWFCHDLSMQSKCHLVSEGTHIQRLVADLCDILMNRSRLQSAVSLHWSFLISLFVPSVLVPWEVVIVVIAAVNHGWYYGRNHFSNISLIYIYFFFLPANHFYEVRPSQSSQQFCQRRYHICLPISV